jgi:hypothetical protein
MQSKKKLILPLILGLIALALSAKALAQTQTNFDLTVSPVFFDLTSNPGEKITDRIRVRNNTTSDMKVKVGVKKMGGDQNGTLTLLDGKDDPTTSWIVLSSSEITAKALEWTDVPFSINIPSDAAFGYYYAVTFSQTGAGPLGQTGTSLTGSSAVPILLNVRKEGAQAKAEVVEFSTENYINEYLPIDFTVKVENKGNIHVKPHGNIFIASGSDKNIAILDVNQTLGTIIPNTNRTYQSSWDDGFLVREPVLQYGEPKKNKKGDIEYKLSINWNKLTSFRIGKYTANLLLVYDDGTKDKTVEATTSFWVFPWKAVLIIIGAVIILLVLLRFILKAYIKRELKKETK